MIASRHGLKDHLDELFGPMSTVGKVLRVLRVLWCFDLLVFDLDVGKDANLTGCRRNETAVLLGEMGSFCNEFGVTGWHAFRIKTILLLTGAAPERGRTHEM